MAPLGLTARGRLAPRATQLKRAWAAAVGFVGLQAFDASPGDHDVPDYSSWSRHALETHVAELEHEVRAAFTTFMIPHDFDIAVRGLAEAYDAVRQATPYLLATVAEFEREIGCLDPMRAHMEVPRYAHLVLQGSFGVGVRHAEWHLARDVQRLLVLYRGALAAEKPAQRGDLLVVDTSDAQTFARVVILACFNLLEAFVLGLAHEHAMTIELDPTARKKVLDAHSPLERRIREIPALILKQRSSPDHGLPPSATPALEFIFGIAKMHRDSFVHCEPGREAKRGYIREDFFHTEDAAPIVEATVENTWTLIQAVWLYVHCRTGPRWLGVQTAE